MGIGSGDWFGAFFILKSITPAYKYRNEYTKLITINQFHSGYWLNRLKVAIDDRIKNGATIHRIANGLKKKATVIAAHIAIISRPPIRYFGFRGKCAAAQLTRTMVSASNPSVM